MSLATYSGGKKNCIALAFSQQWYMWEVLVDQLTMNACKIMQNLWNKHLAAGIRLLFSLFMEMHSQNCNKYNVKSIHVAKWMTKKKAEVLIVILFLFKNKEK